MMTLRCGLAFVLGFASAMIVAEVTGVNARLRRLRDLDPTERRNDR